ncbi:MAG: hypothetical protein LW884_01040 [Bacteroidetes bacterium]|jgi:hypothetical protein|nr:hypothetical protein [Bacteroidota bacterium]
MEAAPDLNELQFRILDSLYFVEPFETIVAEAGASPAIVGAELKELIARRLVQVMAFDEQAQDYLPTFFHDADDMGAYHYLATREGLMKHNGRA